MSQRLSSREIDDKAAEWAAKVDAGALLPGDEPTLAAWLNADSRHLGAFAKARAIAEHTRRARALGPHFEPARFASSQHPASTRRQAIWLGGIAASAATIAVSGGIAWWVFWRQAYATRMGETRVVALEDGSVVTLNTDTEVIVDYTQRRREIQLLRGEALFDVAKDKQRPFVVNAAGTIVRAVGTSFTVSLWRDRPVEVLVREGVVEIRRPDQPAATAVRAMANTRAIAAVDAPIVATKIAPTEVERAIAWRVGRIAFEGETLQQAADDFARYSDIKIIIDDPDVGSETITGLFVANDPVGFSKAVALSLNLHAHVEDERVHISRQ